MSAVASMRGAGLTRAATALLAAALAAATAAPAAADDRADAERYFRTGERLLAAGELAAAATAFDDAYEILPLPEIAFSAAQSYRLAYVKDRDPAQLRRAIELYRIYLGAVKRGGRVKDATGALAELEPQLARAVASGPTIAAAAPPRATGLMITSEVSPATGTIADQPPVTGELPLVHEVRAGRHTITVVAPGYRDKTITAIAVEGELVPVEVDLEPLPASLTVTAARGARVRVDGRTVGDAPLPAIAVPAGRHVVTVSQRGRRPLAREVTVGRGEAVTVAARLRPTAQRRASRWVLIGSGAVLAGAGLAGLGALAADRDAAAIDARRRTVGISEDELARYQDRVGDRDDRRTAMWALGGVAVAAGVTGGLMYLLDHDEAEAPATIGPTLVPAVGQDGFGLVARGRF